MSRDVEVPVGVSDNAAAQEGHLPECPCSRWPDLRGECLCSLLRACEARVREEYGSIKTVMRVAKEQRAAGLAAARDAIMAVEEEYVGDEYEQGRMALRVAVAAIDAVRARHNSTDNGTILP